MSGMVAAPALAAGPVTVPEEPPVAVQPVVQQPVTGDWGGFYAGAQLGYADVDSNGAGLDGNGLIGGVHGGYRFDFGRTVIGGELDYDFADVDLDGDDNSLDSVARLKLTAGADLGRTLLYGTLGAAYAEAEVGGDDLSDNGYFGGIGVTYLVNDRWTVGGEILLHQFDDFDGTGVDLDATTATLRTALRF